MKIGILSDTHDQLTRTRAAVALLLASGAEALIHCGDLTTPEIVYECMGKPAYFVLGNCDVDRTGLRRAIGQIGATCLEKGGEVSLGGRRLSVTHGDSDVEIRRLLNSEPDYLFSGHTHRQTETRQGRTRWINPGALHRAPLWTVVLLDLETDHASVLPIMNEKMQE